jgi:hypothetical protein
MAAGALAAGLLIDVPFLIASRGEMWSMVVTAQLERHPASSHPYVVRIADLTTAYYPRPDQVTPGIVLSAVLGTALLIAILLLASRVPAARLVVGLAIATLLTLLASPAWFEPYADFAAAPVALCAAAAAQAVPIHVRLAGWIPAVSSAAITVAVFAQGYPAMYWWGPKEMSAEARTARCVTSDSPAGLIALDVLDRDLHNGCTVWVDPIGQGYLDSHEAGSTLATNREWQRQMVSYLQTGDLAYPYLLRTPLDPSAKADIARFGAVIRIRADGRRFVLYRQQVGTTRGANRSTH